MGHKMKKKYKVRYRWLISYFRRDSYWRVWKRYETEKAAKEAVKTLNRSHNYLEFKL